MAQSTFRGKFAQSEYARRLARIRGYPPHRASGIVLGFVGAQFWPYAYDDFIDYTFSPYAYDTFWPYAFDDVYEGIYGDYAPEYYAFESGAAYGSSAYAYAGKPASAAIYGSNPSLAALPGAFSRICAGQAQDLADFPIERIADAVHPNEDQRHLLDNMKAATAKAVGILQASCPSDLPSTPTGRLDAMHARVDAMLQAVRAVRPPLDAFYRSLSDEQKERLNALDEGREASNRPDIARLCGGGRTQLFPIRQIQQSLHLNDAQNAALAELNDAARAAADILKTGCTDERTLTPTGRLAAMERRLDDMLRAVDTVKPALAKFFESLSDEQKARVDRMSLAKKV